MPQVESRSRPPPPPTGAYANTTAEESMAKFPIREKHSNKCVVYALASFVCLFAVSLLFASIVFHVRDPEIELTSATLKHNTINYHRLSPSSNSFNATIIARMTLNNPNFGRFYYENTTLSMLYGDSTVGASHLEGATMKATKTKEINFKVKLVIRNLNLTDDLRSGMLKLRSYAKLRGTVHVLKIVKKRKIVEMSCIMSLHLASYSVHHLYCLE